MRRIRFIAAIRDARGAALHVLLESRNRRRFAHEILDHLFRQGNLPATEHALATQLVNGVLRRRATLDALLKPFLHRPLHQIESWLLEVLRLGAFQLVLMSGIPPYAALHETVKLCETIRKPRGKRFVNAVLRSLSRSMTATDTIEPAADAVPLEAGRFRVLSAPVFADPKKEPVQYLAAAFSLPRWLVERWFARYGWDECLRLGFWFAVPGPLWLRCNVLRTDRETCLAALAEAGIDAEPGTHPQSIRLRGFHAIADLPHFKDGWFTVQDHSAMEVASVLAPSPGMRVLDLCAAPGGKTTHLAEWMRNQGEIIACDIHAGRLENLRETCRRLGISIVSPLLLKEEPPEGPFDAALVDVPCSNTGVLGRRPEVRWRLKPGDFQRLIPLQTKLLIQAVERVRTGGTVVYSTCSMEPEENGGVVRAVLSAMPRLSLEAEKEQMAGQPGDGGYWARLRVGTG
ncbi:MAG: ribosomal RNA small subunit methyltransferase B [Gemmatales bacterium]|nr:MAG: ribosomal RNA small subunit methyltransferase B [Gemmatales bacterium]